MYWLQRTSVLCPVINLQLSKNIIDDIINGEDCYVRVVLVIIVHLTAISYDKLVTLEEIDPEWAYIYINIKSFPN